MTKVQFANITVGELVDNVSTGVRYRVHQRLFDAALPERLRGSLLLRRVTPHLTAPLTEIVKRTEHSCWTKGD